MQLVVLVLVDRFRQWLEAAMMQDSVFLLVDQAVLLNLVLPVLVLVVLVDRFRQWLEAANQAVLLNLVLAVSI